MCGQPRAKPAPSIIKPNATIKCNTNRLNMCVGVCVCAICNGHMPDKWGGSGVGVGFL